MIQKSCALVMGLSQFKGYKSKEDESNISTLTTTSNENGLFEPKHLFFNIEKL